jgi:restriction system protein
MAIPDFQSLLLPLLRFAGNGGEHTLAEARDTLAREFQLPIEEREKLLPSGRQKVFDNRVSWAKVYLQQADLLSSPRRGHFQITEQGRALLGQNLREIDIAVLERFDVFRAFRERSKATGSGGDAASAPTPEAIQAATPEELLEQAYETIRAELVSELLARVKACSPLFFENLVVELMLKMGYGGSRAEAGAAIGRTGDEGIDGIIHEDRLGLDTIYLQAKRWQGSVGRPEVQKFVGALHGKRARKGVFITKSWRSTCST